MGFVNDITLRLVNVPWDLDFLYQIMTAPDQYLFSTMTPLNSKDDFANWFLPRLQNDFHDFRVIMLQDKLIGVVYNYDFSLTNGHCKICTDVLEQYRNSGTGGVATILYMNYLFQSYPLRKIYSTVYEYNRQSLLSNARSGFVEEGVITRYKYHDGKYSDIHYFSISRESFNTKLRKYIGGE